MSGKYKTSHRFYAAWDYRSEIRDLDRESKQGWQLVRGGCFSSRFVKNPAVRYRYQLDFGKIDDMPRYIETFREQGWEYVNSTFNGWHYFRKLYDPSLPETAYEIFTDRESLAEMKGRWTKIALAIGVVLALFAAFSLVRLILRPCIPEAVRFLAFFLESALLLRGSWIMRSADSSGDRRSESLFLGLFLVLIIAGAAANIVLTDLRPNLQTMQQAGMTEEPVENNRWADFSVSYPDFYYLDLRMEAGKPFTFALLDAEGKAVYTETSSAFEKEDIRIRLDRGDYCFSMTCPEGTPFAVECTLH